MEVKTLQVLLMPNGEVLYMGRTLGWINDDIEAVRQQKSKEVQISPTHMTNVNE